MYFQCCLMHTTYFTQMISFRLNAIMSGRLYEEGASGLLQCICFLYTQFRSFTKMMVPCTYWANKYITHAGYCQENMIATLITDRLTKSWIVFTYIYDISIKWLRLQWQRTNAQWKAANWSIKGSVHRASSDQMQGEVWPQHWGRTACGFLITHKKAEVHLFKVLPL